MIENNEVLELIEELASYTGKLYNGLENIVANFRQNKTREALQTLAEATRGFDWVLQAISAIKSHHPEYDWLNTDAMVDFLGEMLDSADNMDYVLLADLIEYEILPILDRWGNKLDEVLEDNINK